MKKLTDSYAIDENSGLLYVWAQGEFDAFAPPGTFPPWFWRATPYTFEFTKTWGPSGLFWDNSPLQFATELTAQKVLAAVKTVIRANEHASITMDSQRVGLVTRVDKRMITVGAVSQSAGDIALLIASNPQRWPQMVLDNFNPPKVAGR